MTEKEIEAILASCLPRETHPLVPPTEREWRLLGKKIDCTFPSALAQFVALMSKFRYPGDVLNVGAGPHNGNDSIDVTYEMELSHNRSWNPDMVPFLSVGNGDYFCVSRAEGQKSAVYYYFADRGAFELYCEDVESWLRQLPHFLA